MPITKAHTFRELSDAELQKRIEENKESLETLRFQKATSQVENSAKFEHLRKEIARMMTILKEREKKSVAQKATA